MKWWLTERVFSIFLLFPFFIYDQKMKNLLDHLFNWITFFRRPVFSKSLKYQTVIRLPSDSPFLNDELLRVKLRCSGYFLTIKICSWGTNQTSVGQTKKWLHTWLTFFFPISFHFADYWYTPMHSLKLATILVDSLLYFMKLVSQ